MQEQKLDVVVEKFLKVFPVVIKYFMLIGDQVSDPNYSNQDYQVLHVLKDMGKVPTTTVGKILFISKSRMTAISDKLIDVGLIKRLPDKNDRRIVNIALTEKGKEFIFNYSQNINVIVNKRFSNLSEDELEQFLLSITNFQNVMSKTDIESKKGD